jgi:hypothetical protein
MQHCLKILFKSYYMYITRLFNLFKNYIVHYMFRPSPSGVLNCSMETAVTAFCTCNIGCVAPLHIRDFRGAVGKSCTQISPKFLSRSQFRVVRSAFPFWRGHKSLFRVDRRCYYFNFHAYKIIKSHTKLQTL